MSADANIKTIAEIYEAFGRGDVAAILDSLTDDVDWAAEAASHAGPLVRADGLDSHLGGARTLILPGRIGPATRESA